MNFEVGDKVIMLGDETWEEAGFAHLVGKQGVVIQTDMPLPHYGDNAFLEINVGDGGIYTLPHCIKKVGEEQLLFSFMEE